VTPYTVSLFPGIRQATIEVLRAARRKNMVHSFVDGAPAARFLRHLIRRIERKR
jgi:pyruvate/2-oxoglutarate dehydrogenase complex dihydrolipoamide acyltransferase (E2) component